VFANILNNTVLTSTFLPLSLSRYPYLRSQKPSSAPINTPKTRDGSKNRSQSGTPRSRDGSPRVLQIRPTSEDIPMEHLNSSPSSRCSSNAPSRSHTPSRLTTDSTNGLLSVAKEVVAPTASSTSNGEVVRQQSEETSFMSSSSSSGGEEREKRRKGAIETV
jgi:protein CLEC16A